MEIRYPAVLEPQDGGGFFVRFPDFDDTFTEGDTEEEALFNASEVLTAMLEVKIEDGVIKDLAYIGTGCAISQASTAMMAELLQGRTVEEGIRLCRLFLDMIRGKVTDDESLEELEAAITLKDISKMPVRVKCATLGWHTLEMALTRIEKQLSEQK